jgi:predicted PurR-regulated permease PerM
VPEDEAESRESTARRACITTLVAGAVIVGGLALWKLRLLVALLLFAITIAAAMRPGVEALARHRIPRPVGVLLHYLALLALFSLFLAFVVPRLTTEIQGALQSAQSAHAVAGGGVKARLLDAVQRWLHHLPSGRALVHPALSASERAFKIAIGIFFTFAAAAYWLFERDKAVDLVASLIARPRRKKLRDTWTLIEQKLGAFVRGELILIAFVSTVVSIALVVIGEPYAVLIGIGSGFLEIVPVVGPLVAVGLAVGAGLTVSWHIAALAGGALLAVRLVEDYVVSPRILGGAVGLSPLVVLISVVATDLLLGGFYVLLAIPLASLIATIIDVTVRDIEPTEVEIPTVLFPAQETET